MRWITLGDLHLKLHYNHGVETKDGNSRYLDLRDRIVQVRDFAIKEKIDFLVLSGDEFDTPGPNVPEELKSAFIRDLIKPLNDNGITIFAVAGNHNFNLKITGLDSTAESMNNFFIFYKTTKVKFKGQSLIFIPWSGEIPKMTEDDIIFGHLEIKESKIGIFERKYSDGYSVRAFMNCKAFYFSHFHKHQTFLQGKGMYVGSLIKLTFDERDDTKGFTISELTQDNKIINTFIELYDRNLLEWKLQQHMWSSHTTNGLAYIGSDPDYKIPFTKEQLKDSVLKIVLIGSAIWYSNFDLQLIRKLFKEKFDISKILFDKKYPKEAKKISVEEIREFKGNILKEAIKVYCKELKESKMTEIGINLLDEA